MLSLAGVPGIYVSSLFGSGNDQIGVSKTGRARSINREKFNYQDLEDQLSDPNSRAFKVFNAYSHFLKIRKEHTAFHPLAPQQILDLDPGIFSLIRSTLDLSEDVLCLVNISENSISLDLGPELLKSDKWIDILTERSYSPGTVLLEPYQVMWLTEWNLPG